MATIELHPITVALRMLCPAYLQLYRNVHRAIDQMRSEDRAYPWSWRDNPAGEAALDAMYTNWSATAQGQTFLALRAKYEALADQHVPTGSKLKARVFGKEELLQLRTNENWTLLAEAAVPLVYLAVGRLTPQMTADDQSDFVQDGMLAAAEAVHSWDPEKGAFSTWIMVHVRGALLHALAERGDGGTSSRHLRDTGQDPVIIDSLDRTPTMHEDGDEPGGGPHGRYAAPSAWLTYSEINPDAPEGFGEVEEELDRESSEDMAHKALEGLTPEDVNLLTRACRGESEREIAVYTAKPRETVRDHLRRAEKRAAQNLADRHTDLAGDVVPYDIPPGRQAQKFSLPASRYPGFYRGFASVTKGRRYHSDNLSNLHANWAWNKKEAAKHNPVTIWDLGSVASYEPAKSKNIDWSEWAREERKSLFGAPRQTWHDDSELRSAEQTEIRAYNARRDGEDTEEAE